MNLKYTVTETKGPDSFDPINADKTQNISVMRMLFAAPLEISRNNHLTSKILTSFEYDRIRNRIIFNVRNDQRYSDGTILTADDVALSIARTAYFRPDFPIIKDIVGVKQWANLKQGLKELPEGIQIESNKVIISLSRKSANPLFRFSLEVFSIIPAKCIDRISAKMTCEIAPSSGYFEILNKSLEKIVFKKRSDQNTVDPIPYETIEFQYKTLSDACKETLSPNELVSGIEIDYLTSDCSNKISKEQVHWMPSSRFAILRFNPHVYPFGNQKIRQIFSEVTREVLRRKNNSLLVERGLFTKLLPGYIPTEFLETNFDKDKPTLKGVKINLPAMKHTGFKMVFNAVVDAARELQMDVNLIDDPSLDSVTKSFINGEIPVAVGASGFWAQDPIGDVAMWFTPNLHPNMLFVWNDKRLYDQISSLETDDDPLSIQTKMTDLNRYISDQALLAPVLHYRRLFISSKLVSQLNLPQAVTSPAPWQLVPEE